MMWHDLAVFRHIFDFMLIDWVNLYGGNCPVPMENYALEINVRINSMHIYELIGIFSTNY